MHTLDSKRSLLLSRHLPLGPGFLFLILAMGTMPLVAQCQPPGTTFMTDDATLLGDCRGGFTNFVPAGWSNTGTLNYWRTCTSLAGPSTSSVQTPGTCPQTPASACDNGIIYVETDGGCGADAILESPRYDASGVILPTVSFAWHLQGADTGTLDLEAWNGSSWTVVWSISGDQGAGWQGAQVTVPTYADQCLTEARFRFRYVTTSTGNLGDCALDIVTFGEPADPFGSFAPIEYQENSALFGVSVDGVQVQNDTCLGTNHVAAASQIDSGDPGLLQITSDMGGRPYDLLINTVPLLGASQGALALADGQLVNLDIAAQSPVSLAETFLGASLLSMPPAGPGGSVVTLPLNPAASSTTLRAQGFALDAAAPVGVVLSQAISVTLVDGFLITGDDTMTPSSIDLTAPPFNCISGFPFFGVTHTTMHVGGNGRITFDGSNTDFSPTINELASENPSICAFWTDLTQLNGGTIRAFSPAPDIVRIEWNAVPFWGSGFTGTQNSFAIELDCQTGVIRLLGLQGLDAGQTGTSSGDNQLIGISPGNRAVGGQANDPGAAAFAVSGSGAGAANDMLFIFNDISTSGSSLPLPVVSGLDALVFTPDPATGGYTWLGL